jgi:hypothetical protein
MKTAGSGAGSGTGPGSVSHRYGSGTLLLGFLGLSGYRGCLIRLLELSGLLGFSVSLRVFLGFSKFPRMPACSPWIV